MTENFNCVRCGNCCKEFYPIFTEEDVICASSFLNISVEEFKDRYTTVADDGSCNVINEIPCVFLKNDLCLIHSVKPEVCKKYPNQETAKIFSGVCSASRNLL